MSLQRSSSVVTSPPMFPISVVTPSMFLRGRKEKPPKQKSSTVVTPLPMFSTSVVIPSTFLPPRPSIVIRRVWSFNLEYEFGLIHSAMASYSFVSMDTEFPGVVVQSHPGFRQPENNYAALKANVESMHLIQVGLTLSDDEGNLPSFGTCHKFIWEFNFREFDVRCDPHAPDSIALLRRQGINFRQNRRFGVNIKRFAELMMYSGLVCNNNVQWISFHGGYDFGYLLKALSNNFSSLQKPLLPQDLAQFVKLMEEFFGHVYDVKHLIKLCPNLYGGLDRVSQSLGLERGVGNSHQAASDSLLTLQVFMKIKDAYFGNQTENGMMQKHAGVLYGLDIQ